MRSSTCPAARRSAFGWSVRGIGRAAVRLVTGSIDGKSRAASRRPRGLTRRQVRLAFGVWRPVPRRAQGDLVLAVHGQDRRVAAGPCALEVSAQIVVVGQL